MVFFSPMTKMPAVAPAGGTTLFRMAGLESPRCPGLLEAGGGDTGPIGLGRTSLWFAGADMVVPVLEQLGLPLTNPHPQLCLSHGPPPLLQPQHLRSPSALDPFISQAGGSPEGPGVAFSTWDGFRMFGPDSVYM